MPMMPANTDYASSSQGTSADPQRTEGRRGILRFVLRRVALTPIILFGVTLTVFITVDLSPNNPEMAKLGMFASEQARAQFAAEHGLDDPLLVRYWHFIVDLAHLRLGDSIVHSESVDEMLGRAFPVSIQLMVLSTLLSIVLALVLGVTAAWNDGRLPDRVIGTVSATVQASPDFWIGLMFIQLFAVTLGILPSSGYRPMADGLAAWLSSMIGPAVVLAAGFTAALTRVVRASMSDELAKDYVRTAIGAGVPPLRMLLRGVMRNALVAPITVLGLYVGGLMSGAVLVEVVFNLPGMGTLLMNGVSAGDLAIVRGVAIVVATGFILVNLVVDLLCLTLNPRGAEVSAR